MMEKKGNFIVFFSSSSSTPSESHARALTHTRTHTHTHTHTHNTNNNHESSNHDIRENGRETRVFNVFLFFFDEVQNFLFLVDFDFVVVVVETIQETPPALQEV
jgi:CRISPR/Cas system CSM-associated protein Csm4 (group 5 of RAMP superfamily)